MIKRELASIVHDIVHEYKCLESEREYPFFRIWRTTDMCRQLVPGLVIRLTIIKAKTRPGIEARVWITSYKWFKCIHKIWRKRCLYFELGKVNCHVERSAPSGPVCETLWLLCSDSLHGSCVLALWLATLCCETELLNSYKQLTEATATTKLI